MKAWSLVLMLMVVLGVAACAKKARPLVPLGLERDATSQAVTFTEQGTQAYQARQFEQAKQYFSQAVTAAPQSGQAHYNYALALNALGDVDDARQHFIEAANLAPGDKIIFAACGVTDGTILHGVRFFGTGKRTQSLVMTTETMHVRFVDTVHVEGGPDAFVRFDRW